ncbi:mandelate racemase/muconate lactonizing enzyme family protein [Halalkalicoccus ordinarius]|uniref:mandelate racemase/muconate lactonizing enzyme family protein n=1 Tax=Halalkalicoccus ordinarius TaxID=3116651 RepID=UPI00300ED405
MEIESVEAIPLRRDLDERFANAQKWIDSREYCLVRLTADDGTVGWGECWGPIAGNRELIEEYVAPRLRGRDPRDVERIHDDLVFELRSSFHSYVPASVVSGVDIALWDLRGRVLGEPISRLLGGHRRDEVRAYATGHFFPDVDSFDAIRESVVEEARGHVDAGFTALKNKIGLSRHFPYGVEEDVELVRAIREAVGDDVRLMTDANHGYGRAEALRVARELEALDVHFFEEPLPPEDLEGYAMLERRGPVAIAGGESWAFREEFDEVLDRGAASYLQPDLTSAGGITSTKRVVSAADARNLQVLPHVFGSAIALAASLQVLATIPGDPMFEFDRTPNPLREELPSEPIENDGMVVPVPDGPGIGIEIDPDTLDRFRADR